MTNHLGGLFRRRELNPPGSCCILPSASTRPQTLQETKQTNGDHSVSAVTLKPASLYLLRTVMNEFRQLYGTLIPLGKGNGAVYDLTQPFYRIRWAWVAFPVALEVISTIYFLGIVVATKRARLPLWKNSSLAVMYHGIDPTQYQAGMAAEKISEMDAVAKRTKVRLVYTKLGYRLVGMEEEI